MHGLHNGLQAALALHRQGGADVQVEPDLRAAASFCNGSALGLPLHAGAGRIAGAFFAQAGEVLQRLRALQRSALFGKGSDVRQAGVKAVVWGCWGVGCHGALVYADFVPVAATQSFANAFTAAFTAAFANSLAP